MSLRVGPDLPPTLAQRLAEEEEKASAGRVSQAFRGRAGEEGNEGAASSSESGKVSWLDTGSVKGPRSVNEAETAVPRPLVGMWLCSGSPIMAEIAAGSGLDWLLIDAEHSPLNLAEMQVQLQAIAAYPITPAIRVPSDDPVVIKQILDVGVQNIIVPMVSTADQARAVVAATRYGPTGVRGVGSALARSGRWGRIANYLRDADKYVSVTVQIETADAVANAPEILAVEGVDAVFVGPSDLAASMDLIGQQTHPQVVAAVTSVFDAAVAARKPVGVNAFDPQAAQDYIEAGARFILVGADVTMVARGSEALAQRWIPQGEATEVSSY